MWLAPDSASYLEAIRDDRTEDLLASFAGVPELHDPWHGRLKGEYEVRGFIDRTREWLQVNGAGIVRRTLMDHDDYVCEESILRFEFDGSPLELDIAAVGERNAEGKLYELRVYYRTALFDPQRSIRQPLLHGHPSANPPEGSRLESYLSALASGDIPRVLANFEPDGSFLGSGLYQGHEQLATFFARLFALGGGAVLEHCRLHDDGTTYLLEFNALTRGDLTNHPNAGIAIYQRGPSGLIASARIYDDVQDPKAGDRWA